jgi:predicted NUDIX family NTP pyrophosphohydrolase
MAARTSAGILVHRIRDGALELLLVHPGGPFWSKKDAGAWSIPKGEFDAAHESAEASARREFVEETGHQPPSALVPLAVVKQPGGKVVHAFAGEGDIDVAAIRSNTFEMQWPPRSGRRQAFPEVDRASWFTLVQARDKILAGQRPLLDALERLLCQK